MRRISGSWVVAIVTAGVVGQPQTRALHAAALESPRHPGPVAEAIRLLGWFGDDVPCVELVDRRPRDARATAEAWVRFESDGKAVPINDVATDSSVYRDAATMDYQALVKLAGILVHERWHLRHGQDEVGAYADQLGAMEYLHASSLNLLGVRQALRWWQRQPKAAPAR